MSTMAVTFLVRDQSTRVRGTVLIYTVVATFAIMMIISLAVDLGHVQLAKTQLQSIADASARYAATGMASTTDKSNVALTNASAVCVQSTVDGAVPTCSSSNITLGIWDSTAKTFTVQFFDCDGVRAFHGSLNAAFDH